MEPPKLTLIEAFVNWHIDVMGNGLLTMLFCLFCFAILGLLPSVLAFGRHSKLVLYETATKETFAMEKNEEDLVGEFTNFGAVKEAFEFIEIIDFLKPYTNAVTNPDRVRGCRQHAGVETISELISGIIHQNDTLSRANIRHQ